ncbi:MAG: biotin--[acetyl-CoA-carboxylase] ligase [Bacteroidetes bacterium]|nr:biotin--[acetyl-CoA-carboxylase] ligase [Bacteroidota bacterium]
MQTLFIGQNSIHLTVVDSTNSYASEMLRQIRPVEGTIIYTFEQNQGRGQRGNSWHSEIASLAVADLMAELLPKDYDVKIKWPNDVYVDKRKIAGILIENVISENTLQSSIIGIGLNINQTIFETEANNATSLKLLTHKDYNLQTVMESLCGFLEARYLQLKSNKRDLIDNTYLKRLFNLNEWKNYSVQDEVFEGRIISVSAIGKLQVELHSLEIKEFALKEISFL